MAYSNVNSGKTCTTSVPLHITGSSWVLTTALASTVCPCSPLASSKFCCTKLSFLINRLWAPTRTRDRDPGTARETSS